MSQPSGPNVEQLRGPRLQKHKPDYGRSPPQPALAPATGESARAPAWSELRQAPQSARPAAPLSPGAGYTWLPQLTGVVRRTARLRPSALREASHPGSAILPALDIPSQPHPEIATKSVPRDRGRGWKRHPGYRRGRDPGRLSRFPDSLLLVESES